MTFSIGSGLDSDIRYQDPTISRNHALLHMQQDVMRIEDLNSSNGTKVNKHNIQEALIHPDDEILFGNFMVSGRELIEKAALIKRKQKVDYSREYLSILELYKEYRKKSIKITDPPRWASIVRVLLTITLITLMLLTDLIPRKYQYIISVLIGMTALIPAMLNSSGIKRKERLDALKIEFEDRLVCPKCRVSMIHQSLTYWEGRKRCTNEKCDAIF